MEIFRNLNKLGYKHYLDYTVEELDSLNIKSKEFSIESNLAFDWFRDKYNLVSEIFNNPEYDWKNWKYRFYWTTERLRLSNISDGNYETYEEARLECLKKLIKIVELEK